MYSKYNDFYNNDEKSDCWSREQCIKYKSQIPWLVVKNSQVNFSQEKKIMHLQQDLY